MISAEPASRDSALGLALETARVWALHLLCFVLPLTCLAFYCTAPHPGYLSVLWLSVIVVSVVVDWRAADERRQPASLMPGWPFDGALYALVALQVVNVALFVRMVAVHGFFRMDTAIGLLLQGISSGYSGIVVAHELIHRHERHLSQLGRWLLTVVLYEHFTVEHIRGHHVRVGTPEDPATARFGETRVQHFNRTVPAQFRSAWRLECRRLGDPDMRLADRRQLGNQVLHGLLVEWGIALAIGVGLGPGAFAAFLGQAWIAITLLECVNFFEHWGLEREAARVQPLDSWDTASWFTLYTLVGLSRHADHHASSARPYQQLRYFEESPKLPRGYFGSVVLAVFQPARFAELLGAELERRGLGPHAARSEVPIPGLDLPGPPDAVRRK